MRLALQLASDRSGLTGENPSVGCVIVKNNEVISIGQTGINGRPHAENNAIVNSREKLNKSNLYVTLEPCSHHGKTPPCTNIFKEHGISEVFIGMLDPNPKVNGNGIKELEKNKIITHVGIKQKESMKRKALV